MQVEPMLPIHASSLQQLQDIVFPTLAPEERLRSEQYLHHLTLFPEGQFVLVDQSEPIGMTTTMRCHFDFDHPHHTFSEMAGGGWLTRHQPFGDWLYGLDMGIHPDYRGRGGSRLLYRARQQLVKQLGLKGQLTVGMMNGYGAVSDQVSGETYYQQWVDGKRTDPTLTPQQKIGFRPLGLIPGYLHDPACGDYGVLLHLDAATVV